ncbi:hypothetical protein [Tetragenococcus halophilus]|uniref:hypothetical protein n=1 Tax=Tetragenococcus halophilus TaxID=51669 RepID=UPI0015BE1D95|nr:hypothetical protein [Tetragenococcus halophilus]NWN99670.1 hypothetical protein [Tetragenococcus halophilus]
MIAGEMTDTATFQVFNSGLVAGPSPGLVLAYLVLTSRGNFVSVILGVIVGAAVSFINTMFILKTDKTPDDNDEELETNIGKVK